jgi:fibronectin type 3 domain-containing protein
LEQRTKILSPSNVTKDETQQGKVTITWNPNAVDIDGYEVYRSSSINGTYSLAAVVPIAYASYTDTQVTSGKVYYYRLRSYKKEANGTVEYSSYSQIVEAKAP